MNMITKKGVFQVLINGSNQSTVVNTGYSKIVVAYN